MCFWFYLGTYSIGRLLIEPLRTDSIMFGAIPVPIIASALSLLLAIIGIIVLLVAKRINSAKP